MNLLELPLSEQALPFIIPMLVAGIIKLFRWLPKWTIPVLVLPVLGIASQSITALAAGGEISPLRGFELAALAMFVREISNQSRKALDAASSLGKRVPRVGDGD